MEPDKLGVGMLLMMRIKLAIALASIDHGISQELLHAIVYVESSYAHEAIGQSHGEIGLMQLRPEFHKCASFKIRENINCGAAYLAKLKESFGDRDTQAWWVLYNVGPYSKVKNLRAQHYYRKVTEAMRHVRHNVIRLKAVDSQELTRCTNQVGD